MPRRTLTLVTGRANTGKSAYILDALKAHALSGARAILLVPEQYTFETELRLSRTLGGLLGIQVLSFDRLCERVLSLSGETTPFLSQQGYKMVVRRQAMRCADRFTAFSRVYASRGFAGEMADVLLKLKRCCITPEALTTAASKLPSGTPLGEKLTDVALLYTETERYLANRYLSSEDAMARVLSVLDTSFAAGIPLYIDVLENTTNQHYLLLSRLMQVCASMTVTLRIDPLSPPDQDVFAPDLDVYRRLSELAERNGLTVHTVERTVQDKRILPPLRHLERNLFAHPPRIYAGDAPEVVLFGASSPEREAESLADDIVLLLRRGMRYRDIAVVASDPETYLEPVSRAFSKRGIPVFFDEKRPVRTHAAVDMLLCSLLALVRGVPNSDFLRIAKSGYSLADEADVEELELFLTRTGLRGNALLNPFTKKDVPEGAARAREAIAGPLLRLREGTSAPAASQKTRALYQYLLDCGVDEKLKDVTRRLAASGRAALADEHAQVWNVLMELFSQIHAILGDTPISRKDYLNVLEEGLDGYAIGVVPGTSDQVLFGDVTRTRSRSVRALFVLGANDGLLPRTRNGDTLFSDQELALLTDTGLSPWHNAAEVARIDRLDLYGAIAKAQECIRFSYAFSSGGSELAPSPLLSRIRRILPKCHEANDLEASDRLPASPAEALTLLSGDLALYASDGVLPVRLPALLAALDALPLYRERAKRMRALLDEAPPLRLPAALAQSLYGDALTMSASRLERFNSCPFRHFAEYGLGAKEKRTYEERPADLGTFYHDALDAFVRYVLDHGLSFETLSEETVRQILGELLPSLIAAHNDGYFLENERAHATLFLLLETVEQSACALCRHIQSGGFRPAISEARFGKGCFFPAIPLRLSDGKTAYLEGVIDRVDTAPGSEGGLVRVIDYKTHGRTFDYTGLFHGLTLQLPLYLYAATRRKQQAAGMYYMPLDVPVPEEGSDEADALTRAFLLKGVTLSEAEVVVTTDAKLISPGSASDVVHKLRVKRDGAITGELTSCPELARLTDEALRRAAESVSKMREGDVRALPAEGACDYCGFQSVCRFDPLLPACRARKITKLNHDSFFALIGGPADAEMDD